LRTQVRRAHDAAAAHHDRAVAAIVEVVEFVADQDRRHAARFEAANEMQQSIAFRRRQYRPPLVRGQGPRLLKRRPERARPRAADSVDTRAWYCSLVPRSFATPSKPGRSALKSRIPWRNSGRPRTRFSSTVRGSISLKC